MRELGRSAEPALVEIHVTEQGFGRSAWQRRVERPLGGTVLLHPGEPGEKLVDGSGDVVGALAPRPRDCLQDTWEAGHSMAVDRREVGPAVERLPVGREEDRHRPPPSTGEHLDGLHVDVIHVGSLLAIHLDAHEVLVHDARDPGVLERLPLHDVAPVTGGVADGEKYGFVLGPGTGERFLAPGVPVDGVVSVLEEIGARLVDQPVGGLHAGIVAARY